MNGFPFVGDFVGWISNLSRDTRWPYSGLNPQLRPPVESWGFYGD